MQFKTILVTLFPLYVNKGQHSCAFFQFGEMRNLLAKTFQTSESFLVIKRPYLENFHALEGGGQLNIDRRLDPILILESTIIFRNSYRFVDRFFASKTCRLQTDMVLKLQICRSKSCNGNSKNRIFYQKSGFDLNFVVIFYLNSWRPPHSSIEACLKVFQ